MHYPGGKPGAKAVDWRVDWETSGDNKRTRIMLSIDGRTYAMRAQEALQLCDALSDSVDESFIEWEKKEIEWYEQREARRAAEAAANA